MVYDSYEFGKYLTELRRKYNVSMNVVCDGICDQSVMSRIENGEREVSKLVQDRLLGRLGVAPENFENMVYADEYGYWKTRQEIISLIQHEKMDEADKLLEEMAVQEKLFESGDTAENIDINLKLQFYMAMKAQIRCYNGAGDAELKKMYADASRLTVSRMKDRGSVKEFFSNRRLAVDEINLLLEYWRYVSPEIGKRFIRGAIEYIDKSLFDVLTKAKIYPKAVYYLCLLEIRTGLQNEKKINQLMNLVTQAIEALRNCLRAFYLCELLDIKIELLRMNNKEDVSYWDSLIKDMEQDTLIDENYDKLYGNTDEFSDEAQYIWCRYTRNVLGEIYKRCGVREDTFEYSHIYVDREVYCIEDIIRIRRKMLNMSMYKLGDGICSERTISRIERKRTRPQCSNIHKLFEKLGLSGELSQSELISSNVQAQELLEKIRISINYKKNKDADTLMKELENIVSLDMPQNRQTLERVKACFLREEKIITDEESVKLLKSAMECTLPYRVAVSRDNEVYLTIEELSCMHNILVTKCSCIPEVQECYAALLSMYEVRERDINNCLSMYEFIMRQIASYMGDCGDYDKSDEKEFFILQNSIRNRRLTVLYSSMYSMLWNDQQRVKNKMAMHRNIAYCSEIKRCIVLSNLSRNIGKMKFFSNVFKRTKSKV